MTRNTYAFISALMMAMPAASSMGSESVATPDTGCWTIVPSPSPDVGSTSLYRVAVVSGTDVWASVNVVTSPNTFAPMAIHWDGNQWSLVSTAAVATPASVLQGVAAVASNDVWMVGAYDYFGTTFAGARTLVEHWDGTQWNVVPSPNHPVDRFNNFLRGVTALSANDVWAVGYLQYSAGALPLIEHWDGTQWSIVASPAGLADAILHDVKGLSTNDVWAVGFSFEQATLTPTGSIAIHWDGSQWSTVATPDPGQGNYLTGVAPVASNDVWAVGWSQNQGAFTIHWDGAQWSLVSTPLPTNAYLYGVAAIAPNDVWAVGDGGGGASLAMHWDGMAWNVVPTPNAPGTSQSYLWGIAVVSPDELWAVNYSRPQGSSSVNPLVEHFTRPCAGSPVPLTSVVSRMAHGSAGTFDIDLPVTGDPGIECRSGGPSNDYMLIFSFLDTLTSVDGASLISGVGLLSSSNIDPNDSHNYIVNLTGVTNAQTITVSLSNVTDSAGNFSSAVPAQMGVLLGDVNASRRVDAADVSSVRQQTLQPVTASNFRNDINASGRIDAADVSIARQQTLTSLP